MWCGVVSLGLEFPMFMGMNRRTNPDTRKRCRVPHVHGDEPNDINVFSDTVKEFPMFMGMNRSGAALAGCLPRVPHVHGDEPFLDVPEDFIGESSPCSWG